MDVVSFLSMSSLNLFERLHCLTMSVDIESVIIVAVILPSHY